MASAARSDPPSMRGTIARGWRNFRSAGTRRLAVAGLLLVAALLLARYSWDVPVLGDAERAAYDLRAFVSATRVDQDSRVQLVVYDDQTLIAARKRSPLDRGLLAKALPQIDAMGAKAVGIDVLFDQPQDEDAELVAALRAMRTPTFVAYADVAGNRSDITFDQQKYLDSFVARLEGSKARPASIQLDYAHGVARRWPGPSQALPPRLARAMVGAVDPAAQAWFTDYRGAVRYRLARNDDRPVFATLRIDLLADPAIAPALASQIRGRYVIVGGDIVDQDRVDTPFSAFTGEGVPGLDVHASMISQMLDHARLHQLTALYLWLMAGLVLAAAVLTSLLEWRFWRLAPLLLGQVLVIGGAPFLLQQRGVDTLGLPAMGWIAGWFVAFIAVGSAARARGTEQRRFAQSALGKYLPRDIALQIIDNPELLALHGRKQQLFILFSDLEGFTKLSHQIPPETVALLLNRYLETLSQVVLDHGGLIDKFVGDAVVAFWGAPIARADDGERAARAGYAMWQAGEAFRASVGSDLPPIGKTRVGLHYGEAIVGNFGGERRIQYTALGDSMNTAARLESANKALASSVMASREFAERSGLDWWRPMGAVVLRGRTSAVDLYEPAPDFPAEDRAALAEALAVLDHDRPGAIAACAAVAVRYPADSALQNLLWRLNNLGKESAYVLD